MNRRKEHGPLQPKQCRALEHAWHQAAKECFPLNVRLDIRPAGHLTPVEHAALVNITWNRLGVWSRRHTPNETFHAILVRETTPVEHFHVLMHVSGNANLTGLHYALARWFPEHGAALATRVHQRVGYTASGKIQSALGYITKERTPRAAWGAGRLLWQFRPGGPVLGKRYRISANLRAISGVSAKTISLGPGNREITGAST